VSRGPRAVTGRFPAQHKPPASIAIRPPAHFQKSILYRKDTHCARRVSTAQRALRSLPARCSPAPRYRRALLASAFRRAGQNRQNLAGRGAAGEQFPWRSRRPSSGHTGFSAILPPDSPDTTASAQRLRHHQLPAYRRVLWLLPAGTAPDFQRRAGTGTRPRRTCDFRPVQTPDSLTPPSRG